MVNSNELHVIGDLIVKGQHLIPPKRRERLALRSTLRPFLNNRFLNADAFNAKFTCTGGVNGPPSTCSPK